MNRGEPVAHDVDLVDAEVMDEMSEVNWHGVSEQQAASFGLALGLYRDQAHLHENRRVAWATATGSVISISVLACSCVLIGTGAQFALGVVVITQMIRALWLYKKAWGAQRDTREMQAQAIEAARELAELHPAHR